MHKCPNLFIEEKTVKLNRKNNKKTFIHVLDNTKQRKYTCIHKHRPSAYSGAYRKERGAKDA